MIKCPHHYPHHIPACLDQIFGLLAKSMKYVDVLADERDICETHPQL